MLSALVAGLHCDTLSSIGVTISDIFDKYFGKFQKILSKKILSKIFENFENFFENFEKYFKKSRKLFQKIS